MRSFCGNAEPSLQAECLGSFLRAAQADFITWLPRVFSLLYLFYLSLRDFTLYAFVSKLDRNSRLRIVMSTPFLYSLIDYNTESETFLKLWIP